MPKIGQNNLHVVLPDMLADSRPSSWAQSEKILAAFFLNAASPLTGREYRYVAREFFLFLGNEITSPSDLGRHHIIFYREWLESKSLANKTIQKKLSAVSSLCKYQAEAGLVQRDITYGVSRPRTENRRETADISDVEVRRIFAALNPAKYTFASHQAILAVGFLTGLRSGEIRTLRMGDIGTFNGIKVFRLTIKGDKRHEIPLHPFVIKALDEHLEVLRGRSFAIDSEEHVLFPSLRTGTNKPMSRKRLIIFCIRHLMRRALRRALFEGIG